MFLGSIPTELRSIIAEHIATWQPADLYVGCSGNFTIERAAWDASTGLRLHSNDVSIYSCALGSYFAGEPVRVGLRESSLDRLDWLVPYLDDGAGTIATMMLATRFLDTVDRADHPYFGRMLAGWRDQFPTLHAKTRAKVEALTLRLASFHAEDVRTWLNRVPEDATIATFPPFLKGGYTKMFAALADHLEWSEPVFDEMDDDAVEALIDDVTSRARWVVALPNPHPRLDEEKRAVVQTSVRNVPVYVYSSEGRHRIAKPRQKLAPVLTPRLGRGDQVGERLAIAPLPAQQFSALRSQYLARGIAPGTPHSSFGVLVDGVLIGAFAINPPRFNPDEVYLMSDFAVAPSDYKNLAKLVLVAATSEEGRAVMERSLNRRLRRVMTTAFSNRPVSMKYRGLFQLDKRADATDGVHKFMLNYSSALGRWTLADGFALWRERWAQTVPTA